MQHSVLSPAQRQRLDTAHPASTPILHAASTRGGLLPDTPRGQSGPAVSWDRRTPTFCSEPAPTGESQGVALTLSLEDQVLLTLGSAGRESGLSTPCRWACVLVGHLQGGSWAGISQRSRCPAPPASYSPSRTSPQGMSGQSQECPLARPCGASLGSVVTSGAHSGSGSGHVRPLWRAGSGTPAGQVPSTPEASRRFWPSPTWLGLHSRPQLPGAGQAGSEQVPHSTCRPCYHSGVVKAGTCGTRHLTPPAQTWLLP